MPTPRGLGLLLIAFGSYVAARLVGTWELYLTSLALVALVAIPALALLPMGRRLELSWSFYPHRPEAGSTPELELTLHNRSWLPSPGLRLAAPLRSLSGETLSLDVAPLLPGRSRTRREKLTPVRRGRHVLPPIEGLLRDPLGLVTRRLTLSRLEVTVRPRLVPLSRASFLSTPQAALSGRRPRPLSSGSDLRGVRPHLPGEPLSHIDWKSTARTGQLMLRETEDDAGGEVVLVLDGTRASVMGAPPETSFEAAVEVAAGAGAYLLRSRRPVALLVHGEAEREQRFSAGSEGEERLLDRLAEVEARAEVDLAQTLAKADRFAQSAAVVVITPGFGDRLLRSLLGLVDRRMGVSVILIDSWSYLDEGAAGGADIERKRFLLRLQSAGIPGLVLHKGDSLEWALSRTGQAAV